MSDDLKSAIDYWFDNMMGESEHIKKGAGVGFNIPKRSNYMDAVREEYGIGVKQVNINDLTQGLPLLGLRVMLNPEYYERFERRLHGLSGVITGLQGDQDDANRQIRRYKEKGRTTGWYVDVTFDNGDITGVEIQYLLPIANAHRTVHYFYFKGGNYFTSLEDNYQDKLDEYIIVRGKKLLQHNIYDDAYRQKILDEA